MQPSNRSRHRSTAPQDLEQLSKRKVCWNTSDEFSRFLLGNKRAVGSLDSEEDIALDERQSSGPS